MPNQRQVNGAAVLAALQSRVRSKAEAEFALHCRAEELYPEEEFEFHSDRKWRFDFAFHVERLAVEVEGLTRETGRHQRPEGFEEDCRKYAAAMLLGWRVLRVTPKMVRSGEAIGLVLALLNGETVAREVVPGITTARVRDGYSDDSQKAGDAERGASKKGRARRKKEGHEKEGREEAILTKAELRAAFRRLSRRR